MRPNPKDEAIELYNKYEQLGKDFTRGVSMKEFAKQCALIAVEYLIANEYLETGDESWWEQVKQELLKL